MDAPVVRKPIIIALYSDTPKCGKSTAAKLIDMVGCPGTKLPVRHTYKFSFATPIKEVIFQLLRSLGVKDPAKYEDPLHKDTIIPELGTTIRYLWQTFGDEWGRKLVCDTIWVDRFKRKMEEVIAPWAYREVLGVSRIRYVLIDDLRYMNEYTALAKAGAWFVKVTRDISDPEVSRATTHGSEGNLKGVVPDFYLVNNGTFEELQKQIETMLQIIDDIESREENAHAQKQPE
jgi:hypothetical protein